MCYCVLLCMAPKGDIFKVHEYFYCEMVSSTAEATVIYSIIGRFTQLSATY